MTRNAGKWEELNRSVAPRSIAAPMPTLDTNNSNSNGDDSSDRPFEQNGTPEILGLYRALMKLSKMGPLKAKPARLLVQLIQEILLRGEKI